MSRLGEMFPSFPLVMPLLPDALHSIRSLLCKATNETPLERMFIFQRLSSFGVSLPTRSSGSVQLKRHARLLKCDPAVDEVDVSPHYALVRFPTGREATKSLQISPSGIVPFE